MASMKMNVLTKITLDPFYDSIEKPVNSQNTSAISVETQRAYHHDWIRFSKWCTQHSQQDLPAHPRVIGLFLESEKVSGASVGSLHRRVSAISYVHRKSNLPSPLAHDEAALFRDTIARVKVSTVSRVMQRRSIVLWQEVVEAIGEDNLYDQRDSALLSLHVSGAFRLIELAHLSFAQVRFDRSGMHINLGRYRSTNPRGSAAITMADDQLLDTVSHLRRWINACTDRTGSLFRHVRKGRITDRPLTETDIASIITNRAKALGYDVTPPRRLGLFQIRELAI